MFRLLFLFSGVFAIGQNIKSIQLFNPQTNDETPVIRFGEKLVLRFDDLDNGSQIYRYTIKHLDRNWKDDGLFFTEFATGKLSGLIDNFKYSFNTHQAYTHYSLTFPNKDIQPKISGNFELIVYKEIFGGRKRSCNWSECKPIHRSENSKPQPKSRSQSHPYRPRNQPKYQFYQPKYYPE